MRASRWPTIEQVAREQRPPTDDNGRVWAAPRIVVARRGLKELWWVHSGEVFNGDIGNHVYTGAKLVLASVIHDRMVGKDLQVTVFEDDGRLTHSLLMRYKCAIERHFNWSDFVLDMDVNVTTVLT